MDDVTIHIESLGIDGARDEDGVVAALQADQLLVGSASSWRARWRAPWPDSVGGARSAGEGGAARPDK